MLVSIAGIALWYGIKLYFSPVDMSGEEVQTEEAGPVDESVRRDMLDPRDESVAEGTEDDTEPADDAVRESSLDSREPSPDPEDNEPIPNDVRKSFLD